jgi:hypothetical protein
MKKKRVWIAVLLWCVADVPVVSADTFEEWMMDYSALTMETLPPPALLIERVIEAAPYSAARLDRWQQRIRRSAWLPQFRIDYVYREVPLNNFDTQRVVERTFERGGGQSQTQSLFYDTDRIGGGPDQSFIETRYQDVDTETMREPLSRTMTRDGQVFPTGQELEWSTEWRAMVLWDLSRLVFHHEESRAVDVQVRESNHRRVLVGEVARRYGELRQAILNLQRDPDDMRWQTVRLVEASFLDAMSDGFLTDYIQTKRMDLEYEAELGATGMPVERRDPNAVVPRRRGNDQPVPVALPAEPQLWYETLDDDLMDLDDDLYLDDLNDAGSF